MALAAVSLLLVPAAIAWACNPQAYIRTTQSAYGPGGQVVVQGAFFKGNKEVILNLEPGGEVARVTTASNGSFQTSFKAPDSVGSYSVSAVSFEPDGTVTNGLPARTAFEVAQPAASGAPAGPAPPAATQRGERAFVDPGITRSPTRSAPTGGSGGGDSGGGGGGGGGQPGGGTTGGGAGGGAIVTGPTGVPVFAGSVAPAQPTFGSAPAVQAQATPAASGTAARSSGRAAAADSDVWSGFANGRTPSLTSDAADAPDSDTGPGLGLGIGLLALGLLALVAGLMAAEVKRRKAV